MAYKGAIFDLDGTLVDSVADLADTMNYALKILGQPTWDLQAYRKMVGNSTNLLIKRALGPDKQYLFDEMFKISSEKYTQVCLNKTKPYKNIPETLNKLHKRNVKLAVLTNKDQEMAEKVITHLFGKDLFDAIVGTTTGNPIKPETTETLQLIDKLKLKPQEAVFVGDSDVDMQTAKACQIFALGVSWGFRGRKELTEAGADVIIDEPGELIRFFI
ncbi:MAG: HAD family hydrolase [Sedimentisphaerales bacterium]